MEGNSNFEIAISFHFSINLKNCYFLPFWLQTFNQFLFNHLFSLDHLIFFRSTCTSMRRYDETSTAYLAYKLLAKQYVSSWLPQIKDQISCPFSRVKWSKTIKNSRRKKVDNNRIIFQRQIKTFLCLPFLRVAK